MKTPWQLLNHIPTSYHIYLYTAAFEDARINSQSKWLYGPCDRLIFSVAQVGLTVKNEKKKYISPINHLNNNGLSSQ